MLAKGCAAKVAQTAMLRVGRTRKQRQRTMRKLKMLLSLLQVLSALSGTLRGALPISLQLNLDSPDAGLNQVPSRTRCQVEASNMAQDCGSPATSSVMQCSRGCCGAAVRSD